MVALEEQFDRKIYMNDYMKQYRKNNIEKYTAKEKCEICGCEYSKPNKAHHIKTKKHKMNELFIQMKDIEKSMKFIMENK